jgi:hypothetical protein
MVHAELLRRLAWNEDLIAQVTRGADELRQRSVGPASAPVGGPAVGSTGATSFHPEVAPSSSNCLYVPDIRRR